MPRTHIPAVQPQQLSPLPKTAGLAASGLKTSLALILIGLLSACASQPTRFSSPPPLGTAEEYQLNTDVFRVSFQPGPDTTQAQADELALLHAARLTLNRGFRYFVILGQLERPRTTRVIQQPVYISTGHRSDWAYPGRPYFPGYGPFGGFSSFPYDGWGETIIVHESVEPVVYTIRCSQNATIAGTDGQLATNSTSPALAPAAAAFDAKMILNSLGPKYGMAGVLPTISSGPSPIPAITGAHPAPESPAPAQRTYP